MVDNRLVEYIESNLKKGYTINSIENVLLKQGFSKEVINSTFKFIEEKNKPKNTINKKYLIFSIPIILILIVIIFLLLFNTKTISEKEINQGTIFNLKENENIKFSINNERHNLFVNTVTINSVILTIHSDPIQITLNLGEEKKVNLNNDFYYDLIIKLNQIENNVPEIFIKKIKELMCDEDWNCTEWTNCTYENIQNRNCIDLNDCGSTFNKPDIVIDCVCLEDWNCTEWTVCSSEGNQTRNCTDLNDCRNLENMPIIIRECEYCEEDWLCGNWTECTINETQTRSCEDLNECGTDDDKPNLIQECEYIEPCNPFWDCGVYGECNEDGYKIMTCIDLKYCDINNYTMNYTIECECEENWLCGNWTSCSPDGNQTRTCEDLNDCGTDDDKPDLVQDCVCEEYWNCTEWTECNEDGNQTRTCEDLNDCGTFDDKPDLIQECDKLVGEISISGPMLVEGTGSLYETYGKAYCNRRGQVLTFNIENSMPNTIDEINFDLFINGEKVNYLGEYAKFPIILRYDSGSIVKTFPEGTYKAHLEFMKSVANKEIKIVIDPLNKITPSNPNKTLKFTFPDEKFDLYVHEIDYNYFLEKLRIRIHRDQIIDECPGIDIEIYVNNEYISSPVFSGMNGLIGNYVLGPSLLPGEHEIKIVIDPFDYIDVVNIENKIYIGNITIE